MYKISGREDMDRITSLIHVVNGSIHVCDRLE